MNLDQMRGTAKVAAETDQGSQGGLSVLSGGDGGDRPSRPKLFETTRPGGKLTVTRRTMQGRIRVRSMQSRGVRCRIYMSKTFCDLLPCPIMYHILLGTETIQYEEVPFGKTNPAVRSLSPTHIERREFCPSGS